MRFKPWHSHCLFLRKSPTLTVRLLPPKGLTELKGPFAQRVPDTLRSGGIVSLSSRELWSAMPPTFGSWDHACRDGLVFDLGSDGGSRPWASWTPPEGRASACKIPAPRTLGGWDGPVRTGQSVGYWGSSLYSASATCSPHSVSPSVNERWVMKWSGAAPCQCHSSPGVETTSPGRIVRTGPPRDCTRPSPSVT